MYIFICCRSLHGSVDWNSYAVSLAENWEASLPSRERGLKFWNRKVRIYSQTSLPTRERGLKYCCGSLTNSAFLSLPSRERGLKYEPLQASCSQVQSLPLRERGLKFVLVESCESLLGRSLCGSVDWNLWHTEKHELCRVAPFSGAWIEIVRFLSFCTIDGGAPFAGAWIEI